MGLMMRAAPHGRGPSTGAITLIGATAATGIPALRVLVDGVERAYLTTGSRTVTVQGPARTFTEHKKVGDAYKDDFGRTVAAGFGISPFYGSWSHDQGGALGDYAVNGTAGTCNPKTVNISHYQTLRDDIVRADVEVLFRITAAPAAASSSMGLCTEWVSTNLHNRARVTFNPSGTLNLVLSTQTGGVETVNTNVNSIFPGHVPGTWMRVRHQWSGTTRQLTLWADGGAQPAPTLTYVDTTTSTGRVGFRFFNSPSATIDQVYQIGDLIIRGGDWPDPPQVTHSTWVRVLDTPFVSWNAQVEGQVRSWLSDDTPDVLGHAMGYITGAPAVVDPRLQNVGVSAAKQVTGEARYGPTETDGGREEGSDFNDYIRIPWDYLDLAVPSTDTNETTQQYCLDCPGFLRMIWGYHLGLPMALTDPADFNGLRLPRTAAAIVSAGPGVLIAHSTSVAVDRTRIRVGDVVGFSATAAVANAGGEVGDVEETDDHAGLYLGLDQFGNYLFLSSRRTMNGPGFGPVGGVSYLNGSGFWALAARDIRRF